VSKLTNIHCVIQTYYEVISNTFKIIQAFTQMKKEFSKHFRRELEKTNKNLELSNDILNENFEFIYTFAK